MVSPLALQNYKLWFRKAKYIEYKENNDQTERTDE